MVMVWFGGDILIFATQDDILRWNSIIYLTKSTGGKVESSVPRGILKEFSEVTSDYVSICQYLAIN